MKKLLFILAFVLAAGLAFGQTASLEPGATGISVQTARSFTPILNDSSDVVNIDYDMSKREEVYYYTLLARLWATSKTASTTSPTLNIYEQYSMDGINYSNLDTITFAATQADTTFYFLENSTKVGYPFLRMKIVGVDSVSTQLNVGIGRFIK